MSELSRKSGDLLSSVKDRLPEGLSLDIYPDSANRANGMDYFIARDDSGEKSLYILSGKGDVQSAESFKGDRLHKDGAGGDTALVRCALNGENARALREVFAFTGPGVIGGGNSFGFGDRLGVANPGHVRACAGSPLRPVFAQQSIRELERTGRTPEDVMDAATWAVFQEGSRVR